MENRDKELILLMINSDAELKRLYERHLELEEYLMQYSGRLFLSSDEEMDTKRWKIEKLKGVDRMMQIIHPERASKSAISHMMQA